MGTTEDAEYTERMRELVAGDWWLVFGSAVIGQRGGPEKFSEAPGIGQRGGSGNLPEPPEIGLNFYF